MTADPHDPRGPVKLPTVLALDDDTRIATRAASPEQFDQAARFLDEKADRPELAAELRRLAAAALQRPVVTCDQARPDRADQRAALATARAVLLGDDPAAHAAASAGSCPACTVIAGISYGIKLVSDLAGDGALVSAPVRLAILDAIALTENELRSAPN